MSLLFLFTYSCRKDLCYNHNEHAWSCKLSINPDWILDWEKPLSENWRSQWPIDWIHSYSSLRPSVPKGMEIIIYQNGNLLAERHTSSGKSLISVPEGLSSLLFLNDDTEFILLEGLDKIETASATTRSLSRSTYNKGHENEKTVNIPDDLFVAITEDYLAIPADTVKELLISVEPAVYKYYIRYEFKEGEEYVVLARGALSGMAESVYLSNRTTGTSAATVLFDCQKTSFGAEAILKSFGTPSYTSADEHDQATYNLNLEVMMPNGKIKSFDFDVSDQVRRQPKGGVIIVEGISISKEEANDGNAGFDPEVDGWGDFIDVPLPL